MRAPVKALLTFLSSMKDGKDSLVSSAREVGVRAAKARILAQESAVNVAERDSPTDFIRSHGWADLQSSALDARVQTSSCRRF